MSIIEFKKVGKRYPRETGTALHDLSFSVAEKEFVCLVGPSGCGKTTIVKIIAGLEAATVGTVVKPEGVSMAFQSGALFPWLTVFENVALGLRSRGLPQSEVTRIVDRELRAIGMLTMHDKHPVDLSGGQRQRVGIARALAVDPAVLLLDEPFSALDPKTTAELHDDLLKIWHERNMTVVMVSHVIEEAVSLAGRVVLVKNGDIDQIFPIDLPYPRRESDNFHHEVMKIRKEFFK
ncbi:MAG TPA: ABC transporter ATP-binding protein [Candidatus Paceibacterota bacterium]|nr:ABC transporter ATP-binding protein [Candidatus Paceibacterota bacterium]